MKEAAFTGSRAGPTTAQRTVLRALLAEYRPEVLHHGCAEGADTAAHSVCLSLGIPLELHPCKPLLGDWGPFVVHPVLPPLDRNRVMVNVTQYLIAMPATELEVQRSGTWMTIRYARKLQRPILMIYPNGNPVREGWPEPKENRK